jgi:hypothetical protein
VPLATTVNEDAGAAVNLPHDVVSSICIPISYSVKSVQRNDLEAAPGALVRKGNITYSTFLIIDITTDVVFEMV